MSPLRQWEILNDGGAAVRPLSSIPVTGITFDGASLNSFANGSDLYPCCVDSSGNLFVSGNDGNGWDGVDTRGLDIDNLGTLVPTGTLSTGTEVNSKIDVYGAGLIANGLTLYRWELDRTSTFLKGRVGTSTDGGVTWTYLVNATTGWTYNRADGRGRDCNWIRGTAGNPQVLGDGYAYAVNDDNPNHGVLQLVRMPVNGDYRDPTIHEWFSGTSGSPAWSLASPASATPIFTEPGLDITVNGPVPMSYNPVLNRFLLPYFLESSPATLVVAEAPKPWGPWTEIHRAQLIDATRKFSLSFVNTTSWLSSDGLTWWCVFSGLTTWDAFNVLKATLST